MRTLPVATTTSPMPARMDPDLILVPAVHNTMYEEGTRPTRYYAYSPSCHLTDSTRSTALAETTATTDAPVAYHWRVRIATDRFPATPGSSTDDRPTPRDLRPVFITRCCSLLVPLPYAH
jgi:hypothetical protein